MVSKEIEKIWCVLTSPHFKPLATIFYSDMFIVRTIAVTTLSNQLQLLIVSDVKSVIFPEILSLSSLRCIWSTLTILNVSLSPYLQVNSVLTDGI